jgi:hypothetical protein
MFNLLFDREAWFRPKSHGYGAGLPFKWQGWALIIAYIGLVIGIFVADDLNDGIVHPVSVIAVLLASALFVAIAHRRTEGGWRWHWGGE